MNKFLYILISFSTGITISSAIFAFLTVIGLIPRLISKTKTTKYIVYYENIIILSGLFWSLTYALNITYNLHFVIFFYLVFTLGIFTGSLAVCLTEVIDIIPIIARKFNMVKYTKFLMITIGFGKGFGAFLYYFYELYKL
ncbi:MAG: stage V sporulation protein AB [Lachnospirales bacterium]